MAEQVESIKWIPGTKFMVDGFRFQNAGCQSYFLTHFHADHTTGLTKSFAAGIIFCTPVTAQLLRKDMGMPAERIVELELDVPRVIDSTEVVLIDANHCPGSCMFLFRTRDKVILHTGDLRWDDAMAEHPAIKAQRIDLLFLDTTYASPKHTHPAQGVVVEKMIKIMQKEATDNPRTLFVVGSYHIGKERAYFGVAKALNWKVWCDANKRRVLKMLGLPDEFMQLLVTKPYLGRIHVQPLFGLQPEKLQEHIKSGPWTHVCAFRPTGWTFRKSGKLDVRQQDNVKIIGVPYSEHSSYPELRACVAALRPRRLIPTVNARNAAAARNLVNRFADLMDLSEDRSRLDFFLRKQDSQARDATPAISAIVTEVADEEAGSCATDAISDDLEDAGPADDCAWGMDDEEWDINVPDDAPVQGCKQEDVAGGPKGALDPPGGECRAWRAGLPGMKQEQEDCDMLDACGLPNEPCSPPIERCRSQNAEECSCSGRSSVAGQERIKKEVDMPLELLPGACGKSREEEGENVRQRVQRASPPFREEGLAIPSQLGELQDLQDQAFGGRLPLKTEGPTTDNIEGAAVLSGRLRSRSERMSTRGASCRASMLQSSNSAPPASASDTHAGTLLMPGVAPKVDLAAASDIAGALRSDSCKSSTDHVDVAAIDVAEQQRIFATIEDTRKRSAQQLASCLTKKKQSTLGSFFKAH